MDYSNAWHILCPGYEDKHVYVCHVTKWLAHQLPRYGLKSGYANAWRYIVM